MSLHELRAAPGARTDRRRLGRGHGSGRGKTAGKGTKGQQARAGGTNRPGFEGGSLPMIMRMPFRRGIGFFNPNAVTTATINVRQLSVFEPNSAVGVDELVEAGLIPSRAVRVKVLGDGQIDRPLAVSAHAFSGQAKAKLEAAGGSVAVLGQTAE